MTIRNFEQSNQHLDYSLQLCTATRLWEKKEIYKLRYTVFVQEMAKPLEGIFDQKKQIFDTLDDQSILLYTRAGSNIIGTLRLTIARATDYPPNLAEIFHLDKLKTLDSADPQNPLFCLATKLAILPEYRNSPALFLLIAETYRILREQKIPFCLGGCNPYLVPLYERIGFKRFARNFTDSGYGLLIPLVLISEDTEHLRFIRSPLYRRARKYKTSDTTIAQRFAETFPCASQYPNTQLVTREALWNYVYEKLDFSPLQTPSLKGIDQDSVIDLLQAGAIFHCGENECVLFEGSNCGDIYIVLSGALTTASQTGAQILKPGSHFGDSSISGRLRVSKNIYTLTDSEVFVLPQQSFARYRHQHPQAAEIFLNNLAK